MKISIIIPTYNERENIEKLIPLIDNYVRGLNYEIIVVDDNSPDNTAKVAEAFSTKYPVKVVKRPFKMGLSSAIYDGLRASEGNIVVVMDADLQHPPSLIPKLVKRVNECDIVIASRYIRGGGVQGFGLLRSLISFGATMLTRILIKSCRGVRDPISGFFAAKREVLSAWRPIEPKGYKVLVEILGYLKPHRVCEEPYVFRQRVSGKSKLSVRVILSYVRVLYKLNKIGFLILMSGALILLAVLTYSLIKLIMLF
ncbi:MAG: polyprenol monophosphomannose synthase [Desulfurococcaceae archaeon]|nr:polyprenol monophosphomannose synthase [Desulfurococcaceae archaeon]